MLRADIGRLLELHELLVIQKGFFERAQHELTQSGNAKATVPYPLHLFVKLRDCVSELATVAAAASLSSTQAAAERTSAFLAQINIAQTPQGTDLLVPREGCKNIFFHMMDIVSRLRDDCAIRLYFQINPEKAAYLKTDATHFGDAVDRAFPLAIEDIAEAAACLAVGRYAACVFHLMRAMEAAVFAVAAALDVERLDKRGQHPSWGQSLSSIRTAIEEMEVKSEKDRWLEAHALLYAVNRAWRVEVAHGSS